MDTTRSLAQKMLDFTFSSVDANVSSASEVIDTSSSTDSAWSFELTSDYTKLGSPARKRWQVTVRLLEEPWTTTDDGESG